MIAKRQRVRRRICLSNEKEEDYESDIKDKTDLDKADYKYLL